MLNISETMTVYLEMSNDHSDIESEYAQASLRFLKIAYSEQVSTCFLSMRYFNSKFENCFQFFFIYFLLRQFSLQLKHY